MEDWIHVNPSQGTGGGTVQVTLDPNDSEEDREGNITIQTLTKQTIVKLIQKGVSMYYYVIRENDTDFDLYKVNPSTEEETLLSTPQEYIQAKEDILNLKAFVLLQSTKTQNNNFVIYADRVLTSSNGGVYKDGLTCSFNYRDDNKYMTNLSVILGITFDGNNIYKLITSLKMENSFEEYFLNIDLTGQSHIIVEDGTLVDYQLDSSRIGICNKLGEIPSFPLTLFSNLGSSGGNSNSYSANSMNLKLAAAFHTDLSESPFTTLTLVIPLIFSSRVAYNGTNMQIMGEGLIMNNIFSSPLKIKVEFMGNSDSVITTLEGTKVSISPLISTTPAQTE